ncbi:MAG: DUF1501 domain-containing protein [Planctomycetaceae bacterium]|nr:DUF1501 domain-containing protein [Planctomycetaceae bacterium]MCP4463517.1 DUF1501 domain-containing protein [Planctomycetaceae bacterium]MDG1808008.1 DUF1501 domain-containing protein [Pirellulaceae bacterium]MDG2105376.1 DUF1501 domain-containing protein [Pirellulaceae bacterium]
MTIDHRHRLESRRAWLQKSACGFGALAFSGLLTGQTPASQRQDTLQARAPQFKARAKRVIFIFMQGGPSQVDSLDYKPELVKRDGQEIDFTGVRFGTFGNASKRKLLKPLWAFQQYGECGRHVSSLFPHMAQHVDKLCMIHSMETEGVAHGPSTLFLHTGATNLVRPSVGSWITYGLGTENQNLPGFVTIGPSSSKGGPRNYSNAFLPTVFQGTTIGRAGLSAKEARINNIVNRDFSRELQEKQFQFLQTLNREQLKRTADDDRLEATLKSYELAWRMQNHAPGIMDVSAEAPSTLNMYGIDQKETEEFGRQCLLARRLAEADVRYIQINYADESTNPRWDQHSNMPAHAEHARAVDKPVAGLLADLEQRGLLEDTLVWWGGEFGRTPFAQGRDGRDHNPRGFTVWLAGGGVKPGFAYGSTDEIGHHAVENKVHMHDLHATILHLLGMDHKKLTYQYAGRNFRLTDVAGNVVHDIIA